MTINDQSDRHNLAHVLTPCELLLTNPRREIDRAQNKQGATNRASEGRNPQATVRDAQDVKRRDSVAIVTSR